ncbi:hypothetical protein FEE95_06980 [Maribacter algarum]|uniref:Uncharacterized protein n=1 Tax=Maribacter algarum (ex Zhang et al. 2020) TaxID=2578118 RepID=A0A5S3PVZ3_9FLAO|nr:hypothetical protein [Maribacter algarum]TMM59169.1 hypothetical protein FEE95_06980 [Maribacter algarum]
MKSSCLILLALLVTTAIIAPSVMTLTNLDEKGIVVDFNEEENKEEKKEAQEKEYFLEFNLNTIAQFRSEKIVISSFYFEQDYMASLPILLPPPEHCFI